MEKLIAADAKEEVFLSSLEQTHGRTNLIHLAMLPKGEWPKWCKNCGGSGLIYCSRCLGTGEYREMMGFHFLRTEAGTGKNIGPGKQ
uniref:Uncharacterized protein n=1 Tax=Picea sitchensis TaxID=3332 RepID=A9NQD8_PICSI|nr:unknown [Picea sitchensis]